MHLRSIRLYAAAALVSGLALLPASTIAQTSRTQQLVIGQLQYLPNLHPLIQVNNTKLFMMGFVQRPISAFDSSGKAVCILCSALPSLENGLAKIVGLPGGKKGMEVTIKLLPNLKWGDGQPVTARDIAFTWRMATDPAIGFSNYNSWERASKVDVVNDSTAILHLPAVAAGFDSWDQVLPAHLEEPIYKRYKTADEYTKNTLYNRETTNPGLWNGAYVISSAKLGTQVTLTANPRWPNKPGISRIVLSYRDNNSALVQNLLSGDIDAVPVSPGGISLTQLLTLQQQYANRFSFPMGPGQNLERVAFQMTSPILGDVRVRKAVAYAIDRETISKRLFQGLRQPVATSLLPSHNANHAADVTQYPYDPAKAKALLAEAGWKAAADGVCANAKGDKLAFDLVTTAGNQTRVQIAQVIQSELKADCVKVNIKQVPIAVYNGEVERKRQFNGLILSSIQLPPSTTPRLYLGSDGIPTDTNAWTGNNYSGYSSPAMDAAVGEVETALDAGRRKAGWSKVQKLVADELPLLPLYFYTAAWVTSKDVTGIDVRTFSPPTNWAERWRRQ